MNRQQLATHSLVVEKGLVSRVWILLSGSYTECMLLAVEVVLALESQHTGK